MEDQLRARVWEGFTTRLLKGATVGVIGVGSIGCEVLRMAVQGFGMQGLGFRRSSAEPPAALAELGAGDAVRMVSPDGAGLRELLEASDYVVLALPQVIPPIGAEGLDRRGPPGSCRLFLGPGFRLGARWNRLVETVKTRKKRGKTGENGRDTA